MRKINIALFLCLLSLSCFAKSFNSKDGSFTISLPQKWQDVKAVKNEVLPADKSVGVRKSLFVTEFCGQLAHLLGIDVDGVDIGVCPANLKQRFQFHLVVGHLFRCHDEAVGKMRILLGAGGAGSPRGRQRQNCNNNMSYLSLHPSESDS